MKIEQERALWKLQNRAVKYYKLGEDHRWVTCLVASRIVGHYDKGATAALARNLSLSVRYTENLAKAGVVYRSLRKFVAGHEAHHMRTGTTIKHWTRIGEAMIKYDLSPHEVVETLRTAADEGATVEQMMGAVDGEEHTIAWQKRWDVAVHNLELINSDVDVPNSKRLHAGYALRALMGDMTIVVAESDE